LPAFTGYSVYWLMYASRIAASSNCPSGMRRALLTAIAAFLLASLGSAAEPTELVTWGVWNREGWRKCFGEFARRHPNTTLITRQAGRG